MEVDGEYSAGDQMEVDQQGESIHSMIKSCKFNMKMKMIESARKQVNILSGSFQFAEKIQRKSWKSLLGGLWYAFARADLFDPTVQDILKAQESQFHNERKQKNKC